MTVCTKNIIFWVKLDQFEIDWKERDEFCLKGHGSNCSDICFYLQRQVPHVKKDSLKSS